MVLLHLYFPEVSSIKDIAILQNLGEFELIANQYPDLMGQRIDTKLAILCQLELKVLKKKYIETILQQLKEKDPRVGLLIFNIMTVPSERWQRDGGIAISVSTDNMVYIEVVGKGFDSRN